MIESQQELQIIVADWPAPKVVKAFVTTRQGGASQPPYGSFNLALHVQDERLHVQQNRRQLEQLLDVQYAPQWLHQVHGSKVIPARSDGVVREADACFTGQQGLPCAVMTADCLPVFFCTKQGDQVAVAHAGWRGLASGILEATLANLAADRDELLVWLGPAIGAQKFEVGDEVRAAFMAFSEACAAAFTSRPHKAGYWLADLYQLARLRLQMQGVENVYGGDFCTYSDDERFFSYRRDGVTGRMASLIWISP